VSERYEAEGPSVWDNERQRFVCYTLPAQDDESKRLAERIAAALNAQAGAVEATEDAIEKAYWEFDARKRGYGKRCFGGPQSERDAFKWAVRALAAVKEKDRG